MHDFEKLGMFYLGRPAGAEGMVLYDARDLVTHGLVIGMTGSGKTGLCLTLLEEALIDGIPVIAVDPKGDVLNLLLGFPELRGSDFAPWVDADEARRRGLTVEAFAEAQAEAWRQGLAEWGQDGGRIRRLREAAEMRVFTPGATFGRPVSVGSPGGDDDVSGLLALMGLEADPLQSREHILLSMLVSQSGPVDLPSLVGQIQSPPFDRVGVVDLESFFPARERFALAMRLNNVLASPGFSAWLAGDPLDVDRLLWNEAGRPCASIFSIAHLGDAERMFFVTTLLGRLVAWMRRQSGTSSLRALIFMDEIFGYFPPVANPPSKGPLLTLLKQARAFGLGVLLATQNPVDLDYKGLSNIGTWFIGRLQTERDQMRVLDGLSGVSGAPERSELSRVLAGLKAREFLMHDVHEDRPVVFQTRWALSYLRGPLSQVQIRSLAGAAEAVPSAPPISAGGGGWQAAGGDAIGPQLPISAAGGRSQAPVLPPEVPQCFIPPRKPLASARLEYRPVLLGAATVRFTDTKSGTELTRDVTLLADPSSQSIDWTAATPIELPVTDLESSPALDDPTWADVPPLAARAKSYDAWRKSFATWLFATQRLDLFTCAALKLRSEPGESERDFRIRVRQADHERKDAEREKLRAKYAAKIETLRDREMRAQQALEREQQQASQSGLETALSVGASLLGSFLGRRSSVGRLVSGASTAVRGAGRTAGQAADVRRAQQTLEATQAQRLELEARFEEELSAMESRPDPSDCLETVKLAPKRSDITVHAVTLAWAPWQSDTPMFQENG